MAVVRTIQLAHLPSSDQIHICLFKNVQNTEFLQQQLLAGNTEFQYAFVDASLVISETHILAACFRAVNDLNHDRLRSRNVHSEIVLCLSPTNNISAAFRTFGIRLGSTRNLLAIKVSTAAVPATAAEISEHLGSNLQGDSLYASNDELEKYTNLAEARKVYKYKTETDSKAKKSRRVGKDDKDTQTNGEPSANTEKETMNPVDTSQRRELEAVAVGMMALRGS